MYIHEWESGYGFDPLGAVSERRRQPVWTPLGEALPQLLDHPRMSDMEGEWNKLIGLQVRDPNFFVAGQLHSNLDAWAPLLADGPQGRMVHAWLQNKVSIKDMFCHFKGNFKGEAYDSSIPPPAYFPNAASLQEDPGFVVRTLEERLRNGSLELLGRYDQCRWPVCVMPLTLEPTKPRLCHDSRFLNLFTNDFPFTLDTLKNLPRMVEPAHMLVTKDEKSGYDHLALNDDSKGFFGLMFDGWLMQYATLPFGFKASCYVYHVIGQVVSSHLREKGVPCLGYIDDRLYDTGLGRAMLRGVPEVSLSNISKVLLVVSLGTLLGYTYSLGKCQLWPCTSVKFLGFISDTLLRAFLLPEDKKDSFEHFRQFVLRRDKIPLKVLQRLAGKCASMALAVPGALFYIREMNLALSKAARRSQFFVPCYEALKEEIEAWQFVQSLDKGLAWRQERHLQVEVATDASLYGWAGVLLGQARNQEVRDYWEKGDDRPIHLKETAAVIATVEALAGEFSGKRVHVHSDNMPLVQAWQHQGSRDRALKVPLKRLFQLVLKLDVDLRMVYVPSATSPADPGSRRLSVADTKLVDRPWCQVESVFGPRSSDLMALDSNAMKDKDSRDRQG